MEKSPPTGWTGHGCVNDAAIFLRGKVGRVIGIEPTTSSTTNWNFTIVFNDVFQVSRFVLSNVYQGVVACV